MMSLSQRIAAVKRDVQYPEELIARIMTLCPGDDKLLEALEGGSRYAREILGEIPKTLAPSDVINWWHGDKDRILAEAYRLKELDQLMTQLSLIVSQAAPI